MSRSTMFRALVTYVLAFYLFESDLGDSNISLNQEEETDYYDSRRSRRRFEDDLELEAQAERRIMSAKKVCHFYGGFVLFCF